MDSQDNTLTQGNPEEVKKVEETAQVEQQTAPVEEATRECQSFAETVQKLDSRRSSFYSFFLQLLPSFQNSK